MSNILNFFLSFDKLMKEKLVRAFYWLALASIALTFGATMFENIWLGSLAGILRFVGFFVMLLLSVVSLRLLCETLIALFRINDNLSPDGGKGETADVDLVEEARKAAEVATAKARDAAKAASEKTRSALDKTKDAASDLGDTVEKTTSKAANSVKSKTRTKKVNPEDITIEPPKKAPVKKAATKKAPAKKTPVKKAATKKAPAKKASVKKTTTKK